MFRFEERKKHPKRNVFQFGILKISQANEYFNTSFLKFSIAKREMITKGGFNWCHLWVPRWQESLTIYH